MAAPGHTRSVFTRHGASQVVDICERIGHPLWAVVIKDAENGDEVVVTLLTDDQVDISVSTRHWTA